jgi:hypothetical protein
MSARILLRISAAVTALFTLGHSMGTFGEPRGAMVPVATVMKTVHFDLFGSERSYWVLFHGYGVLIIFAAAYLTILYWLLSRMPAESARPIVLLSAIMQIGFAVIGFADFFWAPGAFNAVSAACAIAATTRRA